MLKDDLQRRARRLFSGDHRPDDLDRLFLGLRSHAAKRDCLREVGDFIAHRDEREKGLTTDVARDVFTSLEVWSLGLTGKSPSISDIKKAAYANLRLASDEQLKSGCGFTRSGARTKLERAFKKIDQERLISQSEADVLQYLGNHFVWKPAFSADQLFTEFVDALRSGDVLSDPPSEVSNVRTFVTLHAAATMHGSTIKLETGKAVTLYAGYANRHGVIEVKANYSLPDMGKPVTAPVCLFLTDLEACNHCEADLLACGNPVLADHWPFPIEIGKDGKLARVS